MKKIFLLFISIFFLILIAAVAIPIFVNIDQFRPKIVQKIEEKTQLKVELGKLSLNIFPSIKIKAKKLKLTAPAPFSQKPLVESEKANLSIPLYALLFSPNVSLNLNEAKIHITKTTKGNSLDSLSNTSETKETSTDASADESSSNSLPSFLQKRIEKAKLNLKIKNSNLNYVNTSQKESYKFEKFNLELKKLGLNSKMTLKLHTLASIEKQDLMLKGPIKVDGKLKSEGHLENLKTDLDLFIDLENLYLKSGDTFEKNAGIPLNFELQGLAQKNKSLELDFPKLKLQLSELTLEGNLKAYELGGADEQFEMNIKSLDNKIERLADLIKPIKENNLKGQLSIQLNAQGKKNNPILNASIKVANGKGQAKNSGAEIKNIALNASIKGIASDPTIQINPLEIEINQSKLNAQIQGKGITKPDYKIEINSKHFDLDSTILSKENSPSSGSSSSGSRSKTKAKALDQALNEAAPTIEEMLKNPLLNKARLDLNLNITKLTVLGAQYENFLFKALLNDRNLKLSKASFKGYNGGLEASGNFKLNPEAMGYSLNSELSNISLEQATRAHAPAWEKEIGGTLNGSLSLAGQGLRKKQLDQNLSGKFNVVLSKGFTSVPVSKIMGDALNKLPQKLNAGGSNDAIEGKFKTLNTEGSLAGRKVKLNNLYIHFEPTDKKYGDFKFKAKGSSSFDRYLRLEGVAFLDPKKFKWPEAQGKSGDVEIPLRFEGPMNNPKPDLGYTVKKLGDRVLKQSVQKEIKKNEKKLLKEGEKVLKKLFNF